MIENRTFTREELLQIKGDTPVEGFKAFWEKQYADARNWKCSYNIESELWSPDPDCRIYRLRYTSIDGFSIGAWIVRPAISTGGALIAHGYGHPATPPLVSTPGRTSIMPCVRGLGLSQCKEIPWQLGKHALFGFEDPEKYVITGGVRDLWIALTIMVDMFPDTADNILCTGGSLGGAMGAMCIPWDERIHYGDLNIPTLGGRILLAHETSPDGPGEARRQKALASEAGMRIIDFCNASAAAQFIRVPTLITPALSDPVVPPPGQFAVANAIPEAFRIMRIREAGHSPATGADRLMEQELEEIRQKVFVSRRKKSFGRT
jgi:cephalosporin-C deacetylase